MAVDKGIHREGARTLSQQEIESNQIEQSDCSSTAMKNFFVKGVSKLTEPKITAEAAGN